MSRTSQFPSVAKGLHFPFQISAACWMDLLGYGASIAEAEYYPLHPKAKDALKRLRTFHKIVADHSAKTFPTLVMNDGAVAYRDLSFRSASVTSDFLARAWALYSNVHQQDIFLGNPGVRAVFACGFRMKGRRAGIDSRVSQLRSIFDRFENNLLTAEQAIYEAAAATPAFDVIPQLQANFAFSKAYVAESSGAAGGLPGPRFYVDLVVFHGTAPTWVEVGPAIHWSNTKLNMRAAFAAIYNISKPAKNQTHGLLNGLQIAKRLSKDSKVLDLLRTARKQ